MDDSKAAFTRTRFDDLETASKSMRFASVYTEPFSYCLRHAEVITDQRDLEAKGRLKKRKSQLRVRFTILNRTMQISRQNVNRTLIVLKTLDF